MAAETTCFCYLILLSISLHTAITAATNLDTSLPLVKTSPGSKFTDQFGYSVALHHITKPEEGNFNSFISNARIIAGAPHGTFPGGVELSGSFEEEVDTGLVYQCPVGPGRCGGVLGNGQDSDRRLFDGYSNAALENKTGQLMGAVMYSGGNYFAVCAPLYVVFPTPENKLDKRTAFDDSRTVGRCFISTRSLENFSEMMPCDGSDPPLSNLNAPDQRRCLAGFSVAIFEQNMNSASIIVGAPGRSRFLGQLFYYSRNPQGNVIETGESGNSRQIQFSPIFGLDGSASTTGFITSVTQLDIISGAPRFNGLQVFGAVRVRTQAGSSSDTPAIELHGGQTGEHFGAAVATADLNNDGYDELVVGAPIYTSSILEAGRVYVYENLGGSLNNTPVVLEGRSAQSRFGSSIVNLGDINGDNFEDIVVGAPYENNAAGGNTSGAIYLYYGRSSESGLISRSPDLILTAQNITNTVQNVLVLRGFGFSLASRDIDGNKFNDLLIGAHISGNAVLIRSFSIANVVVEMSSSVDQIKVDTIGSASTEFIVTVCASYTGRGLDNRSLNTLLKVNETDLFSRVIFRQGDKEIEVFESQFVFPTTMEQTCINISAFIKPIGQLSRRRDFLTPITIHAQFSALPQPTVQYVDGSPSPQLDYRDFPLITMAGNSSINVNQVVTCDSVVCRPDLTISLNDVVYLDSSGNSYNSSRALAGLFSSVLINLTYHNIGMEPARGGQIMFSLPDGYSFQSAHDTTINQEISCQENGDSKMRTYQCLLRGYIPPPSLSVPDSPSEAQVSIIWRYIGTTIQGNEAPQTSDVSIMTSGDDDDSNASNNALDRPVVIEYGAVSDFEISSLVFNLTVPMYRHIMVPANPTIIQLGRTVQLSVDAVNRGPSNSPSAIIDVFLPTHDSSTRYFIYPYRATALQDGVNVGSNCDFTGLNPQGLDLGFVPSSRKRRSAMFKRQESVGLFSDNIKDCSDANSRANGICTQVSCTLTNLRSSQTIEISIEAALDDRYFINENDPFVFVAYATIRGNDSFLVDDMPLNNKVATQPYRVTLAVATGNSSLPIWIPIVCAAVLVIFFILLFILLYCLGCYRRRKSREEEELEDYPPLGPKLTYDNDAGGDDAGDDDDVEKLPDANTDGVADDIGDASDLQDANDVKKSEEPDETSL